MFSDLTPLQGGLGIWAVLIVLWTLPWKGVAMWKAAQNESKPWFVALLVINTLGVLDILYIFLFSKRGEKGDSREVLSLEDK